MFWEDRNGVEHALQILGDGKCNIKSPTLVQDLGKIEETNALPITAIVYGQAVVEGEFAKATIGPLGGKYLVFVSSRSGKMRGCSFLSLHAF